MGNVSTWSTTAASNNAATPDGWPEGQSPSSVNDCARAMMAGIRTWYENAQWIDFGYTHTYSSSSVFTIATTNYTSTYTVGRRVKAVGTATGTIYGTIVISSFGASTTTITVVWDSGSLSNESLTISLGIITPISSSFIGNPVGTVLDYAGTTAPTGYLLCYGQAVSRTTYAALFTVISTSFGVGDASTTFNLPDCRGRVKIGLDNLGGSSANRITSANADSLNNTGAGLETTTATGLNSISINAVTLVQNNLPASISLTQASVGDVDNSATGSVKVAASASGSRSETYAFTNSGGGQAFTPTGSSTFTGNAISSTPPWIALGAIIKY